MIAKPVLIAVVLAAGTAAAAPAVPNDLAVYGDGGVQLAGKTLFKGQVDSAAYDPQQDLIWFVSAGTLEVIDLRAAAPAPIEIARKLPVESFLVTGFSTASYEIDYVGAYVHFDFGKKPKVTGEDGAYAGVDETSDKATKAKAAKVSIVGKAWLAAQKGRKPNPTPAVRADGPKAALPAALAQCEDPDLCGSATWLGGSPYQLVLVTHSCGDACHVTCALYDPNRKLFAAPLADGGWAGLTDKTALGGCMGYTVDAAGARYALGTRWCTLGATMTCTDLAPWNALAWIPTPAAAAH